MSIRIKRFFSVLVSLGLLTVAGAAAAETAAEIEQRRLAAENRNRIMEQPLVELSQGSTTASVLPCGRCNRVYLKVTPETKLIMGDKTKPLTPDVKIRELADVMYNPKDKTMIWVRPLSGIKQ